MLQLAVNTKWLQLTRQLKQPQSALYRKQWMIGHPMTAMLTRQNELIYARRFQQISTAYLLTTFLSSPIFLLLYTHIYFKIIIVKIKKIYLKQDVIVRSHNIKVNKLS